MPNAKSSTAVIGPARRQRTAVIPAKGIRLLRNMLVTVKTPSAIRYRVVATHAAAIAAQQHRNVTLSTVGPSETSLSTLMPPNTANGSSRQGARLPNVDRYERAR